jgi:hypothetical protein
MTIHIGQKFKFTGKSSSFIVVNLAFLWTWCWQILYMGQDVSTNCDIHPYLYIISLGFSVTHQDYVANVEAERHTPRLYGNTVANVEAELSHAEVIW